MSILDVLEILDDLVGNGRHYKDYGGVVADFPRFIGFSRFFHYLTD